eukprot:gene9028-9963_t
MLKKRREPLLPNEIHAPYVDASQPVIEEAWEGYQSGFDWQLERARRFFEEGPSFSPLRMTLWRPEYRNPEDTPVVYPWDGWRILASNLFQQFGLIKSLDGAPMVQGVNTFRGNFFHFLARILDGNLAELAGGPLFLLLQGYYQQYGPVFKLAFGPKSFLVISDPVMAKHILKEKPLRYDKGILAEILKPIMGKGLIPADPETWKVRRKAIVPGFHRAWLNSMMSLFVDCNIPLLRKLQEIQRADGSINMETEFCSVSLDVIGKAVFNYEFNSVARTSPIVKAVYRALQEAEHRSTSFIPYWSLPFANRLFPQLKEFEDNMKMLNEVLDELIEKAFASQQLGDVDDWEKRVEKATEDARQSHPDARQYPSLLRFLVDMRGEDASSHQLRDDLMTMLVAGHETTAAVLTWTFFELAKNKTWYYRVQDEIDNVLQGRLPTYDDVMRLPTIRLCLAETLRLYPEPPLLIRRALEDDVLPNYHNQHLYNGKTAEQSGNDVIYVPKGTDIFLSTYNMHRSPLLWDEPDVFNPDRFLKDRSPGAFAYYKGNEEEGNKGSSVSGPAEEKKKCPIHSSESSAAGCPVHHQTATTNEAAAAAKPQQQTQLKEEDAENIGWEGFSSFSVLHKQLYPNEVNANYAFLPFGGGSRKCVGDTFAFMESITCIALILQRFDLELAIPVDKVGMRTGATIHTENGLMMKIKPRARPSPFPPVPVM